jgi:diguanylate cyclase (GGDEF)-like protein
LPETTLIEATVIAETIRTTLQELAIPHQCSPISQQITVSIGVASLIPQLIQTCDDLIDYADKALYSAKQNGRDCCYAMMS